MGPITYWLCEKPVIGVVMWISSLCAFPPLFSNEPIALSIANSTVSKAFVVPVDKKYPLTLTFAFESLQARLSDQIVGDRFDENCYKQERYEDIPENKRSGLGRPIPFKVSVRRTSDRVVVLNKTFVSLCRASHNGANEKSRTIAWLELPRGEYTLEVINLQGQLGLERVKTHVSLYAGYGK